jgi:Holliday junction resolvasome RuvABC endonuclease subunit
MKPNILALDLGSTVGVCVMDDWPLSWSFAKLHRHVRQREFMLRLGDLLTARPEIDTVVYERPFARGLDATRSLWGMAGVVEAVATRHDCGVLDILPTTIKKWATGSGNAKKEDMILWAAAQGFNGLDEHAADALALYRYTKANIRIG